MARPTHGRDHRAYRALCSWLKANGGNVCHLCGEAIDMRLRHPHPRSWQLDHYVPLSLGGALDDPANARESHRECNIARGNTPMDVWQKPKGTFHLG